MKFGVVSVKWMSVKDTPTNTYYISTTHSREKQMKTDRKTDRQIDRQTDRQTENRSANKNTEMALGSEWRASVSVLNKHDLSIKSDEFLYHNTIVIYY